MQHLLSLFSSQCLPLSLQDTHTVQELDEMAEASLVAYMHVHGVPYAIYKLFSFVPHTHTHTHMAEEPQMNGNGIS